MCSAALRVGGTAKNAPPAEDPLHPPARSAEKQKNSDKGEKSVLCRPRRGGSTPRLFVCDYGSGEHEPGGGNAAVREKFPAGSIQALNADTPRRPFDDILLHLGAALSGLKIRNPEAVEL